MESFLTEGMGIQISEEYRDMLLEGKDYVHAKNDALIGDGFTPVHKFDDDSSDNNSHCFDDETKYPILGPNTTQEDLDEALWVLDHEGSGNTTTWIDLQLHLEGINPTDIGMDYCDDPDDLPLHQLFSGINQLVSISAYASKLHAGIANAEGDVNVEADVTTNHLKYKYRQSFWKWFDDEMKSVIDNLIVTDAHSEGLKSRMKSLFSEFQDETIDIYGVEGRGKTPLIFLSSSGRDESNK